ncbi:polysaccharide biosynthesis protein [Desulfuromonas versatilis]|uniref:Polysaccharide biosynthesis protein n=1 Tax=Desulfuromonas versatilis TaxID=2802975 RepID=A0ABM8HTI1_9BACT|nr:oligosaccharide flippase family protein [Desulfuromonas versatilis]BCR05280.1 polysaccharide biosynthesis protein [Desulfuromonas versatilis]
MLKNVLANWSNIILSVVSVFFLYPFCVQVLGEEQYGIWLLISSITGYFALLQLGVPLANVRFISKYYARGEMEKVNEVVSSNFLFFSISGAVVFICGIGIAFLIDVVFQVPPEFRRVARLATIIVSLNVALSFSFEVFEGLLHGLQKFVYFNMVKNLLLLVRVVLTFVVLKYENGMLVLGELLMGVTLLQAAFFYIFVRFKHPEIRIRKKYFNFDVFKMVAGYSFYVLLFQFASKISFNTSSMVVGSVISVQAIVFFTIANNFIIYFMQLVSGVSNAIMPRVSQFDALNKKSGLQDIYLKYSRLTAFIVVPVCFGLFIFGGDFIALWMGERYREVSGNILSVLTLSSLFFLVQRGVAFPILMGTSHLRFPTFLMAGTALLNLLLSLWWGSVYGLYGVAWGMTVPNFVNTVGLIWYTCRVLKVPVRDYLFRGVLIPLSAGIFFSIPGLLVHRAISIDSYLKFSGMIFVSVVVYLICCFAFYMDTEGRKEVFRKFGLSFVS